MSGRILSFTIFLASLFWRAILLCLFVCVLLWGAHRDLAFSIFGGRGIKKLYHLLSEVKCRHFASYRKWYNLRFVSIVIVTITSSALNIRYFQARVQSEQLQQRWIARVSSLYLGTLGREKGMRETRVEWTEFAWLLITFVWVIFDLQNEHEYIIYILSCVRCLHIDRYLDR